MRKRSRRSPGLDSGIFAALVLCVVAGTLLTQFSPQNLSSPAILVGIMGLLAVLGLSLFSFIRWQEKRRLQSLSIRDVDRLSGIDFEKFVGEILRSQGYHITFTPVTGDFGTDLVAQKGREKISIQLKRYQSPIGPAAVQEAVASMTMYGSTSSMVITNSTFTKGAKKLAEYNHCILVDRQKLDGWIRQFHKKTRGNVKP